MNCTHTHTHTHTWSGWEIGSLRIRKVNDMRWNECNRNSWVKKKNMTDAHTWKTNSKKKWKQTKHSSRNVCHLFRYALHLKFARQNKIVYFRLSDWKFWTPSAAASTNPQQRNAVVFFFYCAWMLRSFLFAKTFLSSTPRVLMVTREMTRSAFRCSTYVATGK